MIDIYYNEVQKKIKTGEWEQNRAVIDKGKNFVYLVMFIKLIFRQSNIVYIGMLSFLIVKTNNLVVFRGCKWYLCHNVVFNVCGYKNSRLVDDCKNIHLVCLIFVAVASKDYHS